MMITKGAVEELYEAILSTFNDDESEMFETFQDIRQHGADYGVPGFTYYSETIEFYEKALSGYTYLSKGAKS